MQVSDFDYFLPEELIAQHPIEPRDSSRLLLLHKNSGKIEHSTFNRLGEYLNAGDVLVLNETRVLPARLYATRSTGAAIEILLLRQLAANRWQALVKPGRKALPGTKLNFSYSGLKAQIEDMAEEGIRTIRFDFTGNFFAILDAIGQMPLPPYIKATLEDKERYQPIYSKKLGSAAAPTAGLHFTDALLSSLAAQGVIIAKVLLHVGLDTFRPVKVKVLEEHKMHAEYFEVDEVNAQLINKCRSQGGRVISVGTTSTRTLETVATDDGVIMPKIGWTEKYIYPGYQFKAIDGLITNFHLPKSTLLMLVSAFSTKENIIAAYEEAIKEKYRFFSFGDAMLII